MLQNGELAAEIKKKKIFPACLPRNIESGNFTNYIDQVSLSM